MLDSEKEERARHFRLALRVGIPLLIFIFSMAYGVFFTQDEIEWNFETWVLLGGMIFTIVYFIYFALEISRKETLLDRITGGYHYSSFIDRAKKYPPKTLAVLQVNNLPTINENFGVKRADELLKHLVELLSNECMAKTASNIYIGRKNGSEFLIASDSEAELVEGLLRQFIEKHKTIDDIDVDYSVAVIRNNINDPEKSIDQLRDILARTECKRVDEDEIQEQDKNSSINLIPDAQKLSKEEQEVLEALNKQTLSFQFRPLKNLKSGRVDIYEVSVKLISPVDNRPITPKVFLPIINRQNFGEHYDFLIFKNILETAKLIDEKVSLSFNISPFSLRKSSFINKIFEELDKSGVDSSRLMVELYERRRHHRLDEYLERLKILKHKGIRLCLDNFGSSNASMEYIRHFPFDMIQLDRDFVLNLDSEQNRSIIKSFVSMAKEMNMLSGAKWVDSQDKVETLKNLDIDYIQGYVAGRILSESELINLYNPINRGKN
jgi:EAL domain-containing protein (putative c-di-GMP-specific phosphodiesterase class I)/GGDEF domain-containing protein